MEPCCGVRDGLEDPFLQESFLLTGAVFKPDDASRGRGVVMEGIGQTAGFRSSGLGARGDVTKLLLDLRAGRKGADEDLLSLVYEELHSLAKNYMRRERPGHTLQTTALVHEAYLRLGGSEEIPWENRVHFLRVAARAMRRVLIDHARRKLSEKRGGERVREVLDEELAVVKEHPEDLLSLDTALSQLSAFDPQMAQVVELRFFAGFSVEETASIMEVSARTVKREWRLAKAWLKQQMEK